MKKNIILMLTAVVATIASFSSCEKAEDSVLPHISGLKLTKSSFSIGEKGEATLTFDQPGANIKGRYKYTITINSNNISGTFSTIPVGSYPFEFDVPEEPGTYTIKVVCTHVDLYSGSQINYLGNMSEIGSAQATFTVTEE